MSTFNVEAFKASLTNGGARPNQFQVALSFPSYVTIGALAVARAPFLVSVAELPGQTVNPAIVQYRGREVKFAGDRVFAPWTITVLNDSDFSIRNGIEQWMDGMDDLAAKRGRLQPFEYQSDLSVSQLDRNGRVLKTYVLRSAMPVDLSPVALDFGANDQISTFTVTWQYQHFNVTGGESAV
jgi:hypothetical protein